MIAPNPHRTPSLRVLMTTDTVGGVWSYSLQLAEALADVGVQVILATEGPRPSDDQRAAAEALGLTVHESEFRLEWMPGAWDDVEAAGRWITRLVETLNVDLVHFNSYSHGALPLEVPKLVAGHSCVFSWFDAVRRGEPGPEWRRYHAAVSRGIAGADMVVAPSRAMMHELERFYGKPIKKRVIYNGRDPMRFEPRGKEPVIFSAGRFWDEAKNIRRLEEAAPSLAWPVYVAGPGARDFQNIKALGMLSADDMARWLGSAAIYALPARYEPFGLSALEAGMAGCALVLGDIPSLREIWGDAAEFVDPDNTEALVAAVSRLVRDEKRRRRMSQRAHQQAMLYSHARMASEYLDAYRQLAVMRGMKSLGTAESVLAGRMER